MISANRERDDLLQLLGALCSETLDAAGEAQLAARLERDETARQTYVRYLEMHSLLGAALAGGATAAPPSCVHLAGSAGLASSAVAREEELPPVANSISAKAISNAFEATTMETSMASSRREPATRQAGGAEIESPSRRVMPRRSLAWSVVRSHRFASSLAFAAVAVTLGLFVLAWWRTPQPGREPVAVGDGPIAPSAAVFVARVTRADDASWIGSKPVELASEISCNKSFHLALGEIELETAHGAKIAVAAPASFYFRSASDMTLRVGSIIALVPPSAHGFVVATPTARVVDRGTEFAVKVEGSETTEVHVFEGRVDLKPRDTNPGAAHPPLGREIGLEANMAVRLVQAGAAGPEIETIDPNRHGFHPSWRSERLANGETNASPVKIERYWYSGNILPSQAYTVYDDPESRKLLRASAPKTDYAEGEWVGFSDMTDPRHDTKFAQPRIDFELAPPSAGEQVTAVEVDYYVFHHCSIFAPTEVRVWAAADASFENVRLVATSAEFNNYDFSGKKPDWRCVRRIRVPLENTNERFIRLDFYNDREWTFLGGVRFYGAAK